MPIIYKIHDIAARSIYDGVLQDGILYQLDGEVKMQLREIPYWGHGWYQYEYNLCVISFGELFGYADIESGQIIHQPCWEDAMPFYGGLARVKEKGKFGFINIAGEYAIDPQWDETESSADSGLIAVRRDDKWGFVNKSCELVTALEWDAFAHASFMCYTQTGKDFPRAVYKDEKWGFIDDCGNIVIEPQFDTLDFVWLNFHVQWREDKTAATVIKGGKEVVIFGRTMTTTDRFLTDLLDLTVYPMYLSVKRKSHWYRVQVGVDSQISVLKGKHPKKNKDIQEAYDFEIAMRGDLK